MFSFRAILARLVSRPDERIVTLRFRTTARIARGVSAEIKKLLADDASGVTYRCSIAHWCRYEGAPLFHYNGNTSVCRINGPLLDPPAGYPDYYYLPTGGLVESPGVTVHLDPNEADELKDFIRDAIDEAIVGWLAARAAESVEAQPAASEAQREASDHV